MSYYNLGRAKGEIVIDSSKAERGFDKARDAQGKFAAGSRKAGKDHDTHKKSTLQLVNATILLTGIMKLVKFPAIIAGANLAAIGLRSLAAAAIALVSALGPALGVLAALPGLLSAAAQGFAVAKLATGGLGAGIKALGKPAGGGGGGGGNSAAKKAADNAKQQESNAENLRQANRAVAAAIRQAAESIVATNKAIEASQASLVAAGERYRASQQRVLDLQGKAKKIQDDLTQARLNAVKAIEQLKNTLESLRISEEEGEQSVADTAQLLRDIMTDPQATDRERKMFELNHRKAVANLNDLRTRRASAETELADANAKGVEGSEDVQNALANQADLQRDIQEATADVATAFLAVKSAVLDVEEAEKAAKQAQIDGADEINEANLALGRVIRENAASLEYFGEAGAGAGSSVASAFDELAPSAKKFATFLFSLKPKFDELREAAAAGLFPGVQKGIEAMLPLFPMIKEVIGATAGAIGNFAARAGALLASGPFASDFKKLADQNVVTIERAGTVILNLADIFRNVMSAAMPLVDWITKLLVSFSASGKAAAELGRTTGVMGDFFTQKVIPTLTQLGHIIRDLVIGFFNVGKAGSDLGQFLLDRFEALSAKFRAFTESTKGEASLKKFFDDAKEPLEAIGRLISALFKTMGDLGGELDFAKTVDKITNQIVPALAKLGETASKVFTEKLIDTAEKIINLITKLSSESGPLTIFVGAVGTLADVFTKILGLPGVAPILYAISVTLGGLAALKLAGFLTGISGMTTKLAGLTTLLSGGGLTAGAGSLTKVLSFLGKGFQAAGILARGFALALGLPLGPFLLIAAAVAGLAYLIYRNWDTIKEKTVQAFNFIKDHIGVIMRAVLFIITGGLSEVVRFVISNWDAISRRTSEIWNGIRSFFGGVLGGIRETFFNIVNGIRDFFVNKFNEMRDRATDALNGLKDRVSGITTSIKKFFTDIWDGIARSAETAVNNVIRFFNNLLRDIRNIATDIGNWIKSKIPFMSGSPIPMVVDARAMAKGVNKAFRTMNPVVPGIGGFQDFQAATSASNRPATYSGRGGGLAAAGSSSSVVNNYNANVNGGNVDVDEDRLMEMFGRMELLYG